MMVSLTFRSVLLFSSADFSVNVSSLRPLTGDNWLGVQLDEFAKCESNLATNRQTRMMSDLALVGCYNRTSMPKQERDSIMLASAKRNLASMAYFGLTEYQKVKSSHSSNIKSQFIKFESRFFSFFFATQISQYVFEETFNLRFALPFEQHNSTVSTSTMRNLRPEQQQKVRQLNALDIELYDFAKKLLFQRFERLKTKDVNFEERFNNLGSIAGKNSATEFNWEKNLDDANYNEPN